MKNLILPLTLLLSFPALANLYRGHAIKDCVCKFSDEGDESDYQIKKSDQVGETCGESFGRISCGAGLFTGIDCPKDCVQLIPIPPLKEADFLAALNPKMKEYKELYSKKVPSVVLNSIQKKYPLWLPVAINKSDEPTYFTDFVLLSNFYMQLKNKAGKEISIVYFFQDLEKLKASTTQWAFLDTLTGEILYDSIAPYKARSAGYTNEPCLSFAGDKLEKIVLYGHTLGKSDAAGCCGPYDLENLTTGPKEQSEADLYTNKEAAYMILYSKCGDAIDPKTGRLDQNFFQIDGPANIRNGPDQKSHLVGVCADKASVIKLGTQKNWVNVFCDGNLGWTSLINIRKK